MINTFSFPVYTVNTLMVVQLGGVRKKQQCVAINTSMSKQTNEVAIDLI